MTRIHGILTNKYLNLATKAKTEKFYVLKDIAVIFKRIGYAFTHRGTIITDKKLAEWAVDAYENTPTEKPKDPEEKKGIKEIKQICQRILPRVKNNQELQNRYDLAYAKRQPLPVDSDDKTPNPSPQNTPPQTTVSPEPKTEIEDEESTDSSDSGTESNGDSDEEEPLKLKNRLSPISEKAAEPQNPASVQINIPVMPEPAQPEDIPSKQTEKDDSSSSNTDSEDDSNEAKGRPTPTVIADPSKTFVEDEEEISLADVTQHSSQENVQNEFNETDFHYNSWQSFSDKLRELTQRLNRTILSELTQGELFALINNVLELDLASTTSISSEDALEWKMLKMRLLSDLSLGDAKAFVSQYSEYKREVTQYNVPYRQYLNAKQLAKRMQKAEAEEQNMAPESSVSSEAEEKGKDLSVSLELKESLNLDSLSFEQAIVNLQEEVGSPTLDSEKVYVKALAVGEVIERKKKTVLEDKEARGKLAETLELGRALLYSLIVQNSKMSEEDINRIEDILDYFTYLEGMVAVEEEVEDFITPNMSGDDEITYEEPPKTMLSRAKSIGGKIVEGVKGAYSAVVDTVKNITQYDEPVANRVKASKYEKLLGTLQRPLLDNLEAFVGEPNDQKILEHLQNMREATELVNSEQTSLEYLEVIRHAFQSIVINNLRAAVTICEQNPNTVSQALQDKVFEVCYELYTSNDMGKENKDAVHMLTTYEGAKPYDEQALEDKFHRLFDELRHTSETIDNAPRKYTALEVDKWLKSGKDAAGIRFSPIGAGNPPQHLNTIITKDRTTRVIGMGSPTMQGTWTSLTHNAEIDPIFRGVQKYMSSRGEKQLYVSLQDARKKSAERLRTEPTKSLEKEFTSFYTIILSKNTHFYEGNGAPADRQEFEKELHRQVFECDDSESGCYISPKVRVEIFEKTGARFEDTSKEMIASISQLFFIPKEELTVGERKAFQELYYNFIVGYAQTQLGIDFINFTCKDGIDRGMGALAWYTFMMMIMSDKQGDPKAVVTLKDILYPRAYWTRKRNIIKSREERFIKDAMWLMDQFRNRAGLKDQFKGEVLKFMPEMQQTEIASLA